jgi:hypothetical protein
LLLWYAAVSTCDTACRLKPLGAASTRNAHANVIRPVRIDTLILEQNVDDCMSRDDSSRANESFLSSQHDMVMVLQLARIVTRL